MRAISAHRLRRIRGLGGSGVRRLCRSRDIDRGCLAVKVYWPLEQFAVFIARRRQAFMFLLLGVVLAGGRENIGHDAEHRRAAAMTIAGDLREESHVSQGTA